MANAGGRPAAQPAFGTKDIPKWLSCELQKWRRTGDCLSGGSTSPNLKKGFNMKKLLAALFAVSFLAGCSMFHANDMPAGAKTSSGDTKSYPTGNDKPQ